MPTAVRVETKLFPDNPEHTTNEMGSWMNKKLSGNHFGKLPAFISGMVTI